MPKWVTRWRYEMAEEPTLPGVWKLRDGSGWYVRGRATDPKTGKQREVTSVRAEDRAEGAFAWLRAELDRIRSGKTTAETVSRPRFNECAASMLERKVSRGRIWSPKGHEKWMYVLKHHLGPVFGDMYVDAIERSDVEAWYDRTADRVRAGQIAASSATSHLSVLKQILPAQCSGLGAFIVPPGQETYTEEEPNSLLPTDVPRFLAELKERWPQHYAMALLGFSTGLRPSSMRPLRRQGETPDVLWDEGVILVRRSQTQGEAIGRTKTDSTRGRVPMPDELARVFRWHVGRFEVRQVQSDLLFPSVTGGYRAPSVLDKPFVDVSQAIGLKYVITARAMRRTFQDLCRAAEMRDVVTRAVSGHATEAMQRRYSTVSMEERREGVAKVISIATGGRAA